jgi:hypothetical protein
MLRDLRERGCKNSLGADPSLSPLALRLRRDGRWEAKRLPTGLPATPFLA